MGRRQPPCQSRRAVNQEVFTVPIIAQQISLPAAFDGRHAQDPAPGAAAGYEVALSPLCPGVARTPLHPQAPSVPERRARMQGAKSELIGHK